ncbi:asparagine synthase (glutamine-hydrolyzing) [Paramagnetospirillum kuznetsovii]|uniref:asparagine synthase (glutamine-hydrolyzing) n=1 Tax=Paramagnetospirillum kuznetsovii TaxID=2053833 RepID=A0A364P2Q1_9PROT|nr:asparagine synthase (glutamine-hydrolyzing) [Paramagnetospirillum kuznetsovii]RAU23566.1 asparagine synthase (glutamine-hydrolyzing) [Paramagnetospirillum kuznetsovii]
MCGIFLWIDRRGAVDVARAARALLVQNHRGPDNQALWVWDGANAERIERLAERLADGSLEGRRAHVVLGNNRLAINDPTPRSNQPMASPDGRLAITFNGCIYNFVELRAGLEAEGERFTTTGDTEVLVRMLALKGPDAVRRLNGAWAFAALDMAARTVTLSRDRYGERPLFFHQDGDAFVAASEIKTLYAALGGERVVDPDHLMAFLAFRKWPLRDGQRSFFQGIRRLVPGTSLTIDADSLRVTEDANNTIDHYLDGSARAEDIADDVRRAVEIRLRADVPVAVLLSGGIDSTMIAAFACMDKAVRDKVAFYTASNPGTVGRDLPFARMAAKDLGIELREVGMEIDLGAFDHLTALAAQYDLPVPIVGTTAAMNEMYRAMGRDGIKCVLDGTGGDEIFGGYKDYYVLTAVAGLIGRGRLGHALDLGRTAWSKRWVDRTMVLRYAYGRLTGKPYGSSPLRHFADLAHPRYRGAVAHTPFYYPEKNHFRQSLAENQLEDCLTGRLPDFTAYADHNSMQHSVENRSPFLDMTLAKYMRLPEEDKYRDGFNKWALRKAMPPVIDQRLTWRPEKVGARWASAEFFTTHRAAIRARIAKCDLLAQAFDLTALLQRLDGHAYETALSLDLLSVALFAEVHPTVLGEPGAGGDD